MFIRDCNGNLINTNRIITIKVEQKEDKGYAVIANIINEENKQRKQALYNDKEIDECRNYQDMLSRKLAVNHEVWEI